MGSLITSPPEPTAASYPVSALNLFPVYNNRDAYVKARGIQPPNWDPSRDVQEWEDPIQSGRLGSVAYTVYDGTVQKIVTMTIPASQAASVNLPGLIHFPPYVPAPTASTSMGMPLNPLELSMFKQGQDILNALGISAPQEELDQNAGTVVYAPDDPRRLWVIHFSGDDHNVGLLVSLQNVNGVGAPGTWGLSNGAPVWTPSPLPPDGINEGASDHQPVPVPIRNLMPDELLTVGPFGAMIQRGIPATSSGNGGDNSAVLTKLDQVLSALAKGGMTP